MSYKNKFGNTTPLEGESWVTVREWPNYMVSSFGRVKSISRVIRGIRKQCDYMLTTRPDTKGYVKVKLYGEGRNKIFGVHQLVCSHFNGMPDSAMEVHHKDNNKTNNHYSNLKWLTRQDHILITIEETLFGRGCKGDRHGRSIMKDADVLKIRQLYSTGLYSYSQLGNEYKITKTSIGRIIKRKSWSHI